VDGETCLRAKDVEIILEEFDVFEK